MATSGVIFLASPLQGTRAGKAAEWGDILAGVLNKAPSQTLLQDLDGSTKALRGTSDPFITLMRPPPMQTMIMCYWESKQTQLLRAMLPAWIYSLPTWTLTLLTWILACFITTRITVSLSIVKNGRS